MKKILISTITATSLTFSSTIEITKIDPKRSIIQIGVYSQKKNLSLALNQVWSKRDTYIKKKNGLYTLYAVNIDKKIEQKVLKGLQTISKDAFISRSAYQKIQQVSLNYKRKYITIDPNKAVIQMGVFSQKKTLNELKNKVDKNYQSYILKENNFYKLLVINVENKDKNKILKKLQKFSKDAFFYTKTVWSDIGNRFKEAESSNRSTEYESYEFSQKNRLQKEPELKQKQEIKSTNISNELYQKGLAYFKNKDYKNSHKLFLKVYEQDKTNEKNIFYLARSQYELGLYKDALHSYKMLLNNKPDNARILLETAQTYFGLKQYDKALVYFNLTLKQKLPATVRNKVLQTIYYLQERMINKIEPISGFISFGLGYDTNIGNLSNKNSYSVYIPETNTNMNFTNNSKKKKGLYTPVTFGININKQYDEEFSINSSAQAYMKNNFSNNDENIKAISLQTTPSYVLSNNKQISLGAGYDHIWYGGDSFLDLFSVTPSFQMKLDETNYLNTSLQLGTKRYRRSIDQNRDADFITLESSLINTRRTMGIFKYGLSYTQEKKKDNIRTDVAKSSYKLSLGHQYDFSKQYALNTALEYESSSYQDTDINFLNKRKDIQYNVSTGLSYIYSKELLFSLKSLYTQNNSNQEPFDYDKFDFLGNVTYKF